MKAVILAGGKGTRMRPITYEIPKALIPVHGRTITEHLLDLFKKNGITEIILSVGYMKDKIKDYFQDGSKFGVNIEYIEEDPEIPMGTGGPLRLLKKRLNETFIVSNGDELKNFDLKGMIKFHKQKKALGTIALLKVDDPSEYGVARFENDKILEFVEKPKKEDAPSNLVNSGIYILEPEAIKLLPEGFAMTERIIFPALAKKEKLFGFEFKGQWLNTGNMEDYGRAIKEWKDIQLD